MHYSLKAVGITHLAITNHSPMSVLITSFCSFQKARTSAVRAFNPGKPELENLVSFCPDEI
jgi:hypothetical protein